MSTSTQKKTTYHHGDLRAALIAAALAMLEEGVDPTALSLREAARRAGVSAMAPYRHFADKDALLAAVATIGFERLALAQRDADHAEPPEAALRAQGVAYVAFACANPALFRLMFGAGAPAKSDDLAQAAIASFSLLAERIATTVPTEQKIDHALAKWALVHGLAMLAVDGQLGLFGDVSPIELAKRVTSLAVDAGGRRRS